MTCQWKGKKENYQRRVQYQRFSCPMRYLEEFGLKSSEGASDSQIQLLTRVDRQSFVLVRNAQISG